MSLELIVGPPNSGRAGEVLRRLRSSLDRDPVLVVPTGEDAARFERDLSGGGTAAIGATIRTFASLVDLIADATGASLPVELSDPQRLALVRAAIRGTRLGILDRSSRSSGFAGALDALIAELQAALVDAGQLRSAAEAMEGGGEAEMELAELLGSYVELRERAGASDAGARAVAAAAALRADPGAWGPRPVLIYGFDDLTEAQLDLVRLLATQTEVTIALNYADRRALTARAALYTRLLDDPGADRVVDLDFDPGYTQRASLRHLDRELFEAVADTVPGDDGGLQLLECAGERGEAEAVGLEIARLLAEGADPGDIVVALRRPSVEGPVFAAVLREMGLPVALDASLPLDRTAVGRALLALCRAAGPEGAPADLVAHLRSDPSFDPGTVDWAERGIARGEAERLEDVYEKWRHPPRHLARLREAPDGPARVSALARVARELAERPHREQAPLAGERSNGTPMDPIELRAGVTAAELLDELAAIGSLPGCEAPDLTEAAEAIESATVRAWRGSTEGRIRIASPYRVRAGRARYLFCCSLQEGVFPSGRSADPLLGEERRAALGLPALRRAEQADEERYLFHVCVSRPTDRLYLCWRSSDDEGHPAARSAFVDEVLDLLGESPEATEAALKRTRGLAQVLPAPHEAPDARSLARALTLRRGLDVDAQRAALDALGANLATAGEVLEMTARARPDRRPRHLHHPTVLAELSSRDLLSAGSLENWVECSYRWFVSHELSPQRLEPEADPLWLGGVVHEALHRLYREAPGSDAIPRPGDVGRWRERFSELLADATRDSDSGAATPARRLALARARAQVEAFLEAEAQSESELRPRTDLLERSFGFEEEGDPGPLDLGEFGLRGRIDRIDVDPDRRRALLRDYKTSTRVVGRAAFAGEGKLQLQLYMLALRRKLGLEPIGGVYHPLGARGARDRRPRGMLLKDDPLAEAIDSVGGDPVDAEAFERELEDAERLARERGAGMRAGLIDRDPLNGSCPRYCEYQAICRLERAIGVEDEAGNGDGE